MFMGQGSKLRGARDGAEVCTSPFLRMLSPQHAPVTYFSLLSKPKHRYLCTNHMGTRTHTKMHRPQEVPVCAKKKRANTHTLIPPKTLANRQSCICTSSHPQGHTPRYAHFTCLHTLTRVHTNTDHPCIWTPGHVWAEQNAQCFLHLPSGRGC